MKDDEPISASPARKARRSAPLSPELIAAQPSTPIDHLPTTKAFVATVTKPKRKHQNKAFVPSSPNVLVKASYYSDPSYQARVAKFLARHSGKQADYFARSFSGELYIMRALIVFYQTLAVHKSAHAGLSLALFITLLSAKLYCSHHGADVFTSKQVHLFGNHLLYRERSAQHAFNACLRLSEYNYLNPLRTPSAERIKFTLSMKSRQLFRDLETEFRKPFILTSPFKKAS